MKKLLLVYWEVVEKTGPDGKLLPEMILVTNNLRKDLEHPNENIRGCTLRFLCKLKEAEILEPLIPLVKANLEHRHAFVRRNAVLAIFAIHKSRAAAARRPSSSRPSPSPSPCPMAKRNAFLMLFQTRTSAPWPSCTLDQVPGGRLAAADRARGKVVRANPLEKSKYIRAYPFSSPQRGHHGAPRCSSR